jgi:hypothetical protein
MIWAQTGDRNDTSILGSKSNELGPNATKNNNIAGAKFLFIQTAQTGSISEVNTTTYTLELNDISDKTIMFSDRPDRVVTSVNTTDFIDNWSMGSDSFAKDPPNAVLVLDDVQQKQGLVIIELRNPEYNPEANTLKFDIMAENTTFPIDIRGKFGQSTLVIDIHGPIF